MSFKLEIVSRPDIERTQAQYEHLWVLVGEEAHSDGATAFYLGQDRDIEGDALAENNIPNAVRSAKAKGIELVGHEVGQALNEYRQKRGT